MIRCKNPFPMTLGYRRQTSNVHGDMVLSGIHVMVPSLDPYVMSLNARSDLQADAVATGLIEVPGIVQPYVGEQDGRGRPDHAVDRKQGLPFVQDM